jgi:hypothetical protein
MIGCDRPSVGAAATWSDPAFMASPRRRPSIPRRVSAVDRDTGGIGSGGCAAGGEAAHVAGVVVHRV